LATNISEAAEFHVGFHTGVAYCGAIGSEFKLSLKAMGPDISITKSLCRAAKKYKIGNLMSEKFMKIAPFVSLVSRKIE
jgi:class 3 adenylate cyclase